MPLRLSRGLLAAALVLALILPEPGGQLKEARCAAASTRLPDNALESAATATADMIAGLRPAVSGTDMASISWSLGEHFFTTAQAAQINSILAAAAAHHVTVIATSGDNGAFSDAWFGARRSRRSASRPPTRSCWPWAAPRSPQTPSQVRHATCTSPVCLPLPGGLTATTLTARRGFSATRISSSHHDEMKLYC